MKANIFSDYDNVLQEAWSAAQSLVFFRHFTDNPVFKSWLALIKLLLEGEVTIADYYNWLFLLTPYALKTSSDAWEYFIDSELLLTDNELTLKLQSFSPLPAPLYAVLALEAENIARIRAANAGIIGEEAQRQLRQAHLPIAQGWGDSGGESQNFIESAEDLIGFYRQRGSGIPALYRVMKWVSGLGLKGIESPDPIVIDDLVGYDRQKETLLNNTKRLLSGLPAHHALLYGPRGSGKSSMVKAVANQFAGSSLRLVEVSPSDINDLPQIVHLLRERVQKFIIFIDDLSFEAYETEYRALKALLEGSAESRPQNIVVYATSNRRHIVQEFYSDRMGGDDLHSGDTWQEKLALSDRFGLSLFFPRADQELYLAIVKELAQKRGIVMEEEELVRRALTWEKERSGPSGRAARQFVDSL